jgi:putative SOS response-associated peptidase YedK
MCGRFALTATPEEVAALFGYLDAEAFPPRYNIAPTQPLAIVRAERGARRFALVRWGLIPPFVKDPRAFALLFNARSESAAERPAFRGALRYRRCLVPASGFYEWQRGPRDAKQPFWIRRRQGGVFAFAGLWESWLGADGSEIDTAAILTTGANRRLAPIHNRMPVVIEPQAFERWLANRGNDNVADLLKPAEEDFFEAIAVGERVNAARNDDPGLQEPVAAMRTLLL